MILNTGFYQHDAIRQFPAQCNEVNENLCVKVNFPISITTLLPYAARPQERGREMDESLHQQRH